MIRCALETKDLGAFFELYSTSIQPKLALLWPLESGIYPKMGSFCPMTSCFQGQNKLKMALLEKKILLSSGHRSASFGRMEVLYSSKNAPRSLVSSAHQIIAQLSTTKIFNFCQNFTCRFGCVMGAPSPFFENFRKV